MARRSRVAGIALTAVPAATHAECDPRLRGPDFFDAREFAGMCLSCTRIEATGGNPGRVTG